MSERATLSTDSLVGESEALDRLTRLGEIGTKVDLVDMSFMDGCPVCGETVMVCSKDLGVEQTNAEFYCTNMLCSHFVGSEVEYDHNRIRSDEVKTWDQSAICPDCNCKFTIEMHKDQADRHESPKCGDCRTDQNA